MADSGLLCDGDRESAGHICLTVLSSSGHIVYRMDHNRGGGLSIYTNNNWCADARFIETHSSPEIEYLKLSCRPFYQAREFTSVMITTVYIPPQVNACHG